MSTTVHVNKPISWSLVGEAVDFYTVRGFKYVEAPWLVSLPAIRATLPHAKKPISCDSSHRGLYLVGSAEQSFVEMALASRLAPGNYVAAGPCFRDEMLDELHQREFFKVELITVHGSMNMSEAAGMSSCLKLMSHAATLFTKFLKLTSCPSELLTTKSTDDGVDLELDGVEVGSYGGRSLHEYGLCWTYGTGLAEPRFSSTLAAWERKRVLGIRASTECHDVPSETRTVYHRCSP